MNESNQSKLPADTSCFILDTYDTATTIIAITTYNISPKTTAAATVTMRSLLWTAVFAILMIEVAITAALVLPVPLSWRNAICLEMSKLDLKARLRLPLTFLVIGMGLAFFDSMNYLVFIWKVEDDEERYGSSYQTAEQAQVVRHIDKQKEYKTERNLYLSGFAIVLLFAIGRLTDLMQEHSELELELEKKRLSSSPAVDASTGDKTTNGKEIEMKPMGMKKKE